MAKIMILNGPPRCGKDTAAEAIVSYFGFDVCKHVKFSAPLKDIASSILGYDQRTLEINKDKILQGNDISFRDAQIHTYIQLAQVYGEDWLGKWLVNSLDNYDHEFFVVSDGGRAADIRSLLRVIAPNDLQIVQIMREGCTFSGDIRSYISAHNVRTRPIVNKNRETFKAEMIDFAGEFFGDT